jgi:hypothetical protein
MTRKKLTTCVWLAILALSLLLIYPASPSLAADDAAGLGHKLATIGKTGPKAIDVKISAQKPGGGPVGKDDPMSVKLTTTARAYVTAIYVSPEGDAVVVFPSKKNPDNLVIPGKDYTIVTPDSGLKLGFSPTTDKGKIVVLVSSKQMELDPLKPAEDQEFIVIPGNAVNEMENLANKIAALSKDETFNRKLITPKSLAQPGQGDSIMGLPGGVSSSQPESVAGVQGVKNKIKDLGKR